VAKQFLINSFCMVGDEGNKRTALGMIGLHTHEALAAYVSGFRDDLERHGEWLLINGHEVSINIELEEVEAACGNH